MGDTTSRISNAFIALSLALSIPAARGMVSTGRQGHGFIGFGINMYKPECATTCRVTISAAPLNCNMSGMDHMHDMVRRMDMDMDEPSPQCYATNDAFLETLAYCILQKCQRCDGADKCQDLEDSEIEQWWYANVAGTYEIDEQPAPKLSWRQSLNQISDPPTEVMKSGQVLNTTMLVDEADFVANWNGQEAFEAQETFHETYGLVVFLTGAIIPMGLSLLRFLPFPDSMVNWFNSRFIYPPLWGTKHKQPLPGSIGLVPTRGQGLFVFYLVAINVILSSVSFWSQQPNSWFPEDPRTDIMTSVANRAGVLSFANIPLLILYSSKNSILLILTDWSYSTFLLLHRWVAALATIEAILHSILYLRLYLEQGEAAYTAESKLDYWIWGVIATLVMSILLPTSILKLRQTVYELFLAWHIVLSVLTIVGCYYHIYYRFAHQWGYETWLYIAIALWGFDRVARIVRFARFGLRTATVTPLDADYLRLDVPGIPAAAAGHAYLYFPTLTWRVWENHPMSVAASVLTTYSKGTSTPEPPASTPPTDDKAADTVTTVAEGTSSLDSKREASPARRGAGEHVSRGLTFFVRTRSGTTALLAGRKRIPVLIESSYGHAHTTGDTPNLVCIAGGVGITAVLPYLRAHAGRVKVFWGVRSSAIVEGVRDLLGDVDKEVFIGERMDVESVLAGEVKAAREGLTIVVSGPAEMSDEVRMAASRLGKDARGRLELIDESFSW